MRVVQGTSQFSASDLPVSTCGALSAQNEKHRVQNIVLV